MRGEAFRKAMAEGMVEVGERTWAREDLYERGTVSFESGEDAPSDSLPVEHGESRETDEAAKRVELPLVPAAGRRMKPVSNDEGLFGE